MNITKMLDELRAERRNIDEAITVLQRLAANGAKRRGRPPKWMSEARNGTQAIDEPKRRGRPPGSKNQPKTMAQTA